VIVDNLNVCRTSLCPREAEAVLLIDADTVLPLSVALQRFQVIAGRKPQVR